MAMRWTAFAATIALTTLSGCLARTAVDVVTLPVKAGSKAVDLATTSQSEADEKRGRELRKREERLGKLEREWEKFDRRCSAGDAEACRKRDDARREIDALRPTIPPYSDNQL